MRGRKAFSAAILLISLFLLFPGAILAEGGSKEAEKAGWEEGTPGRWNSLPNSKVEAAGESFRAEIALSPGTGVLWEKKIGKPSRPEETLSIEMVSKGTNRASRDYLRYEAIFPISVTAVFGEDSADLPWKRRFADFFRALWHGFSPGGIRLTFAYGNDVPVGSMYRLEEEETVFILAGREDLGKKIESARDLRADFRAAYGRDPKGPVTRILVSAQRPSREKSPVDVSIRITSPLLHR